MFCPKCGNQLPDGSAFCGKCGAQLGASKASAAKTAPSASKARPASAAAKTQATRSTRSAGAQGALTAFPPLRAAAVVAAAIALLFALMPWFSTSSVAVTASGYASSGADLVAGLTGADISMPEFEESYSVFQFGELASTATAYLDIEAQIADARKAAEAEASGRARAIGLGAPQGSRKPAEALLLTMACWALSCVVLAVGAVRALLTRGRGGLVLGIGASLLAAVSFFWAFVSYGVLESAAIAASGGATNAIVCSVAAVAAVLCLVASRKAKA